MSQNIKQMLRRGLCLETYLQLFGKREIYLENCRRIMEYNDIRIVVQTVELQIEIWGADLQVDSYSPDAVRIHGDIQSLQLTSKGGIHETARAH